jgi:hypothetical protein
MPRPTGRHRAPLRSIGALRTPVSLIERLKRPSQRRRLRLSHPVGRDHAILALLVVLATLATLAIADSGTEASVGGLFQSPPTTTPDPNSPLPSPSATPSPSPTAPIVETPTPLAPTPVPVETPTPVPPPATPTPIPIPTMPSEIVPTVPPPFPTEPLPPPEPTAVPEPPVAPVQPTLILTQALTATLGMEAPPAEQEQLPPADAERRFDLALFIDNFVVALGYIWICCGALVLAAAGVGAVVFLRRPSRSRSPQQPASVPPYQPAAGSPVTAPEPEVWSAPPPAAPATSGQPDATPPPQPRPAARHKPSPPGQP